MKILQSFWVIGFVALAISLSINTLLILKKSTALIDSLAQPKEVVLEGSSTFWHFRTREIENLITNLKTNNAKVFEKEQALSNLESRLTLERQELERIKEDIQEARIELSNRILETQEAEKKNLKSLADTYSTIAPESAVKIFQEMDDSLVVKILAFMPTESIGAILEAMLNTQGESDTPASRRVANLSELFRLNLATKK